MRAGSLHLAAVDARGGQRLGDGGHGVGLVGDEQGVDLREVGRDPPGRGPRAALAVALHRLHPHVAPRRRFLESR